jgi:hypothetical protein
MHPLRQIIRKILLEDDKLLNKWNSNSKNSLQQELSKLGIYTISRGEDDSYNLGAGMHNFVVDVVYKGKRCVARMSKSLDERNSLLRFVSYKDRLPEKFHKHFPKIYKTFEIKQQFTAKLYGTVVEILDPLPPALYHELGEHENESEETDKIRSSRIQLLKDEDLVLDIIENVISLRDKQQFYFSTYLEEILPKLDSLAGVSIYEAEDLFTDGFDTKKADPLYSFTVREKIVEDLIGVLSQSAIPVFSNDPHQISKHNQSSKVQEFYQFLLELEQLGLSWGDLHVDNYMMRRDTGDLVVVDPGYFEDEEAE